MPTQLTVRAGTERQARSTGRHRSITLVELITTAALALSTAVAATAVSIGMARADAITGAAKVGDEAFAVAMLIGFMLVAIGGLTAIAVGGKRRG
jgi:hypothetical protein